MYSCIRYITCRNGYMRFLMVDRCLSKEVNEDGELASKDSLKEKSSSLSYIETS